MKKYSKRHTKTSYRKLKSKKLKGGKVTYEYVREKLENIINDPGKLTQFNDRMKDFYQEKKNKYEKLIEKTNKDIEALLDVDTKSKNSLIQGINRLKGRVDNTITDGQIEGVARENDKIRNRISDNARMSIYSVKIRQIDSKLRTFTNNTSYLGDNMRDFIKACDDFDMGNTN